MAKRLPHGFWWRAGVIHTRDPVTGKRTSTRCHDPRAAELWRAERERLAANPAHAASLAATVGGWVARTLRHKGAERRAGTLHMYTVKLGHFLRLFGTDAALASITPGAVDEYVTTRRREGVSNNTIARELTCLRQMLRLAKRAGEFAGDLDQIMPVGFSADYKPRTRVLLRADLPALWRALPSDVERAWVALALATGADLGDIERAQPGDYDPARNVFRVRGTKTTTRDAEVPVLPHVAELFAFALERLPVSWPRASKALGEACKRAGIPHLSPKDLRRSAASWLVAAGADISNVGRFLRHGSDLMARTVYGRVQPEELGRLLLPAANTIPSQAVEKFPRPLGGTADAGDLKGEAGESGRSAKLGISENPADRTHAYWRALSRKVGIICTPASQLAAAAQRVGLGNREASQ